jgi:hypothetical protein
MAIMTSVVAATPIIKIIFISKPDTPIPPGSNPNHIFINAITIAVILRINFRPGRCKDIGYGNTGAQ